VIVDCPPVLGRADCLAVLPLVDAVLLVVQAGKTRGGAILEVGDRLERVGVSVDAVIMNDVRVARGRPGHSAYGYYIAPDEYLQPARTPARRSLRSAQPRAAAPSEGPRIAEERETSTPDPGDRERPKVVSGSSNANGEATVRAELAPSTVPADEN